MIENPSGMWPVTFFADGKSFSFTETEWADALTGLRQIAADVAMERSAGDTVPPRTAPVTPRERIESLMLSGAGQLTRIFELERRLDRLAAVIGAWGDEHRDRGR